MIATDPELQPVLVYDEQPDLPTTDVMELHLMYAGDQLKAASNSETRRSEKHAIRKHFHTQLEQLWKQDPLLAFYGLQRDHYEPGKVDPGGLYVAGAALYGPVPVYIPHASTHVDTIARLYDGYVPLVNGHFGMYCDLDVIFLRSGPPGHLIKRGAGGGDIDNRLKVLLDALRVPARGEPPDVRPGDPPDPKPMYVLLSDDSLVTSLKVTVGTLLAPPVTDKPSEACVIVHVKTKVIDYRKLPPGYQI